MAAGVDCRSTGENMHVRKTSVVEVVIFGGGDSLLNPEG